MAVRDYLNEGGKLIHAGETAQYQGLPGISDAVGGLYYGLNGDPTAECDPAQPTPTAGFFEDCLILADDFRQYYLGAFTRTDIADPAGVDRRRRAARRLRGGFGGPVASDNPLDEAGVSSRPAMCCRSTSSRSSRARARRSTPPRARPVRAGRGHALRGRAARRTRRTCG